MAQSKKLSNTEKFCIQGMLQNNKSFEDIAQELDRPLNMIQEYPATLETSLKKTKKVAKPKPPTALDLIATKTAGGRKGVAIMTQGASEKGDASKEAATRRNLESRVHKIREE